MIFFVDDEEWMRESMKTLFESLNFDYKIYDCAEDLLTEIQNIELDKKNFLITDYELLEIWGAELVMIIKSQFGDKITTILLSGWGKLENIDGADFTLDKTDFDDDLLKILGVD